ncbi:MAG: sulfatase-like hydrolase/transferase [Alphaproteobacteria bacterium]|nr:sulfatase-like hydrolase/transferase [Alphaproteobacteria bacterium]
MGCRTGSTPTHPLGPTGTTTTEELGPALVFEGDPPRNLLVISIDTLRRDALGRYGGPSTPTLDRLLGEGVALDQHVQCSNWTFPSTTCTQAGRYLDDLGVVPSIAGSRDPLPTLPSMARALRDQGFTTLLSTASVYVSSERNNAQGYDEDQLTGIRYARGIWEQGRDMLQAAMDRGEVDRWLLHLHVVEPHEAYAPPESYLAALDELPPDPWDLGNHDTVYDMLATWPDLDPEQQALMVSLQRARYAGEVQYLDDQLTEALAEADALGWLDDTLVMLWTDHGEAFFEHGHPTHAWTLHAQEGDAIAGFWAKGLEPVGWDGPTTAIDLAPTAMTALGLPVPDGFDGEVVGTADPQRARFTLVNGRAGVQQAVLQGPDKLLYDWSTGRLELYDRAADPRELNDLAARRPDRVRALYDLLTPRVDRLRPLVSATPVAPTGL